MGESADFDWVSNEITLSDENSSEVSRLNVGDTISVQMKVTGVKEEVDGDGKTTRKVTMEVPKDGDRFQSEPVGDERRKIMP